MKKNNIFIFIAAILIVFTSIGGCYHLNLNKSFNDQLAEFTQTRGSEPLDETIGECYIEGEYNKYLYFSNDIANLFYGKIEKNELQRGTDFYSAPYILDNGVLKTNISYPQYGQTENTENISIVKAESIFTINVNNERFYLTKHNPEEIEGMWMSIYVGIAPGE